MPAGAKDCLTGREISRDILTTADDLSVNGGLSIGEHSRPMVLFLMTSEDFLKLIPDSQQLMHTEASLKPGRKVIRRAESSQIN